MAQLAAKNHNIFRLLVVFAVFFVLTSPAVAGSQTRAFFDFVGDSWDSFETYLDGVFDDATPAGTTVAPTATTIAPAPTAAAPGG